MQLSPPWVQKLTEELEGEIVDRQAEAAENRVVLIRKLAKLADERQKLLQAFYANAVPLDLLKTEQGRVTGAEQTAKAELEVTEEDLAGWQGVLSMAIQLAGNCHAAYVKARPSVRRRFNEAVLEAVYVKDRKIPRAEFSEVFAPLFSRPSSNKALKVEVRGVEPPDLCRAKAFPGGFVTWRTTPIGPLACGFGPQRISACLGVSQRDAGRMRDEVSRKDW